MSKCSAVLARPRVQGIDLIISRPGSRRILALCTATAMLNLCLTVAFASPKSDFKVPTGIANVGGAVLIDGWPANSGQTLFSGSRIVTAEGSESTLNLGNRTRLKLYAESRLTVEFSSSTLLGSLEQGTLHGFVPVGIRANIVASEASIVSDPAQPAAFSIQVEDGDTTISVETGRLEVRTGNNLRSVAAGERFSTSYSRTLWPAPQQNSNKRKWIWVFLGIGAAVAVLAIAIAGRDNEPPCEGGIVILSPSTAGPGVCQ